MARASVEVAGCAPRCSTMVRPLRPRRRCSAPICRGEVEIVLEADPYMAAEQYRLRHHRKLRGADAESRPEGAIWQLVSHREHGFGGRRRAPRNAEADLEQRRRCNEAALDQMTGEPDMAEFEHLKLGLSSTVQDRARHLSQMCGRVDEHTSPKFIDPTSRLHTSGFSSSTWATRSAGCERLDRGSGMRGSSPPGMNDAPAPVVRLTSMSTPDWRMRSTISR